MIILVILLHQEASPNIYGVERLANALSSILLRAAFIIANESYFNLPVGAQQVLDIVVGGHDRLVAFVYRDELHERIDAKDLVCPLQIHRDRYISGLKDHTLLIVELCEVEWLDLEGRFTSVVALALA